MTDADAEVEKYEQRWRAAHRDQIKQEQEFRRRLAPLMAILREARAVKHKHSRLAQAVASFDSGVGTSAEECPVGRVYLNGDLVRYATRWSEPGGWVDVWVEPEGLWVNVPVTERLFGQVEFKAGSEDE